jgi:hypothetical protein
MTEPPGIAEAVTDPIGVTVGLISSIEAGLDHGAVEAVVTDVAGGRAKRRKLAQALAGRPAVLTDGRSPAPRVVGDLLIALVKAGATAISPPVCAGCGKVLRTQQRRDENWYCGVCGPVRLPCAGCGHVDRVHSRDRHRQPRCARCGPGGGDPVEIVAGIVTAIDPALPPGIVAAAVKAAATQAGKRHQLAWTLQDRPALLTGAGAETPVPSVLRLIDRLCDAGAAGIIRPRARSAAGSSPCTGRSTGAGYAGTAWPDPVPGPARGAAGSASPPPATPTGCRYVRTAWSATQPTLKSA